MDLTVVDLKYLAWNWFTRNHGGDSNLYDMDE